jgi:diguanylate cyclase (GGDEF)-like protein
LFNIKLSSNESLKFTVSLGVSQVDLENEKNIEFALRRADEVLYEAKNTGRNRVCISKMLGNEK